MTPTRDEDDRLLDMVARSHRRESSAAIGERYGIKASYVRTLLNRVKRDLALSEAEA
jgi:DNA-binding CsgD family transcriptional regulator